MVFVKRDNFLQFLLSHTQCLNSCPVVINRVITNRLKASISGSTKSCFRQNVECSVGCLRVRFDFRDGDLSGNETKVGRRQFPGFLFTVK